MEMPRGEGSDWESISSNPQPQQPIDNKGTRRKAKEQTQKKPQTRSGDPLQDYWTERAKLIKRLEKRFKRFQKKSREDFEKARNPKRSAPPVKATSSAQASPPTKTSASPPSTVHGTPVRRAESSKADSMSGLSGLRGTARGFTNAGPDQAGNSLADGE